MDFMFFHYREGTTVKPAWLQTDIDLQNGELLASKIQKMSFFVSFFAYFELFPSRYRAIFEPYLSRIWVVFELFLRSFWCRFRAVWKAIKMDLNVVELKKKLKIVFLVKLFILIYWLDVFEIHGPRQSFVQGFWWNLKEIMKNSFDDNAHVVHWYEILSCPSSR